MTKNIAHSEDYFKSYRDFWWNVDFLELMARRLDLHECRHVLDIGCGQCHWSATLLPFLAKDAVVTGLDSDPTWSVVANPMREEFAAANATLDLRSGSACDLPFEDNSFDLVTCQTVLIHLENPQAALNEMFRVVRPGGLVLCVEPNNLVQSLLRSTMEHSLSLEERLRRVEYVLIAESGKRLLGEGDNSYGDFVAEACHLAGLADIKVYLSDKTSQLIPPYDTPEERALISTMREWQSENSGPSDIATAQRYFNAFDGRYDELLTSIHSEANQEAKKYWEQIDGRKFVGSGAVLMYLTSGRKPHEATAQGIE